ITKKVVKNWKSAIDEEIFPQKGTIKKPPSSRSSKRTMVVKKRSYSSCYGVQERLLFSQKWISVILRCNEGFLDYPRTHPTVKVQYRTCLIVGSASTGTSKRLLAYDCTGWLVVD